MSDVACTHLDQIHEVMPSAQGCEECLSIGIGGFTYGSA
jgi:hypothetical protein